MALAFLALVPLLPTPRGITISQGPSLTLTGEGGGVVWDFPRHAGLRSGNRRLGGLDTGSSLLVGAGKVTKLRAVSGLHTDGCWGINTTIPSDGRPRTIHLACRE